MFGTSATNQQFPILNDAQLEHLKKNNVFEVWGKAVDGRTVVRFCTSWATKEENVASFLADIAAMPM